MADTRVVITAEVEQAIREINRLRSEATQSLNQLGKIGSQAMSVVKALGVTMVAGAFVDFVKGSIDAVDALNDLSVRTKITISDLSGLAYAAKLGDTSLDGVASAVSKLAMNMGKDVQKFRDLGITASEPLEAFKQLSDIFKDIQDPQQRAAFGAEVLGKSWQEAAVLLDGGSVALEEMINRGKELSGVSDQVAADAGRFNDKLDELGFVASGVGQRLAADLLPLLNLLVDDLTVTGDGVDKATSSFQPLAQSLAYLVVAGGNVVYTFKALDQELWFWAMQLNQVTVAASKFLTLDFKGGLASIRAAFGKGGLGDIATERAEKDRAAFDAWEKSWLNLATSAKAGGASVKEAGQDIADVLISSFLELERSENAAKKAAAFLNANESAAARKKAEAEQASAIKTATEYAASLRVEATQAGLATDQVKMLTAARAAAKAPTAELRLEIMSAALAADIATKAFAASEASIKSVMAASQNLTDSRAGEVSALAGEVQAGKDAIAVFGKSKSAIEALTLARMEDRLARRGPQDLDLDEAEANHLMRMIALQKEKVSVTAALDLLDTGSSLTQAKELLDVLVAVDNAAKSAAQGMAASFGAFGTAIGGFTTALTGYAVQQQAIVAQLAAVKMDPKSSVAKIAQAEIAASKASAQAQIKSYGDMAGAAKGFFSENSKGYKALQAAEKAYRAFEMAMAVESMVQRLFAVNSVTAATVAGEVAKSAAVASGTATQLASDLVKGESAASVAVATQAQGDPYTAWARMAAMAAAMAALGFAVFGGGGGGKPISQVRQEAAGTGTVFGDGTAKSESIKRSLELVANNSTIELDYTRGMLASLRGIESSLSGLGNLLIRTSGLTSSTFSDQESSAKNLYMSMQPFWSIGAGTVGKWVSSVFGGKKTVEDTGFTIDPTTLANAMAGGIKSFQYAQIRKDGGWFHSDKITTEKSGLGDAADAQFAKVINSLGASVSEAAKLLGLGGDEFTAKLNSFVIDIGKISLKDLSGDEIQEQLEAVFSKLGDDMAQFGVGGLEQFQKVGEGYFETLTRVATNYANLDSILAASGTTFGHTGLASIAARERLIELTGGIDKLASQQSSFNENFLSQAEQLAPVQKYVTDQLAAMGLQSLDSRDKFKEYTLGLASSGALATEAGARQYAALLALSEAFAKTHAATVDLTKSEQEIADERSDLMDRLNAATKTSAELLAMQRAALDESNQALYDQVVAAEAAKEAAERLAEANEAAAAKRASIELNIAQLLGNTTLARERELAALPASARALQEYAYALADADQAVTAALSGVQRAIDAEKTSIQSAADAQIASIKAGVEAGQASLVAAQKSVDSLSGIFDTINDAVKSLRASVNSQANMEQAKSFIDMALSVARAGGMPDAEKLRDAINTVTQDRRESYASTMDFEFAQLVQAGKLDALGVLTRDQKTLAERQFDALTGANKLAEDQIKAIERAAADQIKLLDAQWRAAQDAVSAMRGVDLSVKSVAGSIAALNGTIATLAAVRNAASAATGISGTLPTIGTVVVPGGSGTAGGDVLGESPASSGAAAALDLSLLSKAQRAYFDAIKGQAGDVTEKYKYVLDLLDVQALRSFESITGGVVDNTESSDDYMRRHGYTVDPTATDPAKRYVPAFADGGDHTGGLRLVGEVGPELEATGPSRIWNFEQTRRMLSGGGNSEQVTLLMQIVIQQSERLEQQNKRLEKRLAAIEVNTGRTTGMIDQVTSGGNAARVEVVRSLVEAG